MIRLHDLGFGPKLASSIYQYYGAETLDVLDKNPYQLVYDIKGIGFNKADQLAQKLVSNLMHLSELKQVCFLH